MLMRPIGRVIAALSVVFSSTAAMEAVDHHGDTHLAWILDPTTTLELRRGQEVVKGASLFVSEPNGFLVIISEREELRILLRFAQHDFYLLPKAQVRKELDGTLSLDYSLDDPPQGQLVVGAGRLPEFSIDNHTYRIEPSQEVVGGFDLESLRSAIPIYSQRSMTYQPGPSLSRLQSLAKDLHVDVYFRSSCQTCEAIVPKIMGLAEALNGVEFRFHGLPKEGEANRLGELPVAVISRNGSNEIGRVFGKNLKNPEAAILEVVQAATSK